MWLNDGQYCPKIISLWAAICRELAPVESAICDPRREKDFGQPVSAVSNWLQITSEIADSFRVAYRDLTRLLETADVC